jgi:hypothetical protein
MHPGNIRVAQMKIEILGVKGVDEVEKKEKNS